MLVDLSNMNKVVITIIKVGHVVVDEIQSHSQGHNIPQNSWGLFFYYNLEISCGRTLENSYFCPLSEITNPRIAMRISSPGFPGI